MPDIRIQRKHQLGLAKARKIALQWAEEVTLVSETHASDEAFAALETRLSVIEALTDRSLFTASAAYAYSRRAALRCPARRRCGARPTAPAQPTRAWSATPRW